MLFDDRSAFVMIAVDGLPFETVQEDVVWYQHDQMENALRNIATDGLIIHTLQCRGLADPSQYPHGTFRTAFAETLDMDYRERLFGGRQMWLNQTFIGLQLRPRRYGGEWLGDQIAQRTKRSVEDESPTERVRRLLQISGILMESLRAYRPRYLKVVQRNGMLFSEIAEAVAFAMTGYWRPVPLTVGSAKRVFSEKFFIGWETFEVRMPHTSTFGAALGLHDYPYITFPGQFSQFLSAGYRHTIFNAFRCLNPTDGQSVATRKQNRLKSAGDRALSQAKELTQAADLIASNRMSMGDHGFAMLVFADDHARLSEVVERAWGHLSSGGTIVEREDIALEAVLFSVVPGNFRLRGRPAVISSRNFCAFSALHNFPAGDDSGFWDHPAAIFRTSAGTPYKFHLHSNGLGNCFVSGQAGSGKTVWLGFIVAQSEREGAQVVIWDKDHGLESLVLALDGVYMSLTNVAGEGTGLAPLKRLTDSADDLSFLSGLIRACIATPDPYELSPEEDRRLGVALRQVMRLPPADRTLGEIRAFLGTDRNGAGARLEKWIWGPGETPSGEFGWVIDCPNDRVTLDAPVIGFDQSAILTDPVAAGATLSTLFHYSGKLVDGRKLMFVLDEVWAALLLPQFHAQIHNGLKTFRKLNSPIIMATQSVADALSSPIGHTIREQCPTQIYFSNPTAIWKDYGEDGMHLTEKEFEIVKRLQRGVGQFLLKQGDRSVVASAPLNGMDDAIAVISGTAKSVSALEIAKKRTGEMSGARLIDEFHRVRKERAI